MLFKHLQLAAVVLATAVCANNKISAIKFRNNGCRCAPTDSCWPSTSAWKVFNLTLGGKLIADIPPAISCYNGPQLNLNTCAQLVTELTNSTFVGNNPVALGFPIGDQCPPVDYASGGLAGNCSIGSLPRYTVDATTPLDVAAAVVFASLSNIRLVVRNTGHDLLGRSTGYGSLQVWIHHLRQGLTFQKTYTASDRCTKSGWTGSTLKIGGGYVWGEAYAVANANKVIVVGGGDPSVGCLGGWAQGGGHSPANHDYGLGADQILEAQVVVANGRIVTANACQNADLFAAIRGGGGGTYGIVVSTIIKAYPTTNVSAQIFTMAALTDANIPDFYSALTILYNAYPDLSDAGFNGYGSWQAHWYAPVLGTPYTTAYTHAFAMMGKSVDEAQAAFASTAAKLAPYNGTSLYTSTTYLSFPSYATYYSTLSGSQTPVGSDAVLGSRLLDRKALSNNSSIHAMLTVLGGTAAQFIQNNICLVGGGQVFRDAADPNSSVNPAWRRSYVHNIAATGFAPGSDAATRKAVHDDMTFVKVAAMRAVAPDTGCYMNEADRLDPEYLEDFYGGSLGRLGAAKERWDPRGVYYCTTCVGSDAWREDGTGRLCGI